MSSITSSQFVFPSFPKTRSFGQFLTIYDYAKFLCCSRSSSATNLMLQLLGLAILVDDLFSLIPKISGYEQWIRLRAFHHSTTHPWSNPIIRHPSVAGAKTHSRHAHRERQKKTPKRDNWKEKPPRDLRILTYKFGRCQKKWAKTKQTKKLTHTPPKT